MLAQRLRSYFDTGVWGACSHFLRAYVQASGGIRVGWVGGVVRDAVRGAHCIDWDCVVEGELEPFLKFLVAHWGGQVLHSKTSFGTQKYKAPNGVVIDVAESRGETYAHSGALPTVFRASLEEDLHRRDFSMNAMAFVYSAEEPLGVLLDLHHGVHDLEKRSLRVLHAQSFVDDPTRMFRLVRFASRLMCNIEEHTSIYARACVEHDYCKMISYERFGNEIEKIFADVHPVEAWVLLNSYGFLEKYQIGSNVLDKMAYVVSEFRHIEPYYIDVSKEELLWLCIGHSMPEEVRFRYMRWVAHRASVRAVWTKGYAFFETCLKMIQDSQTRGDAAYAISDLSPLEQSYLHVFKRLDEPYARFLTWWVHTGRGIKTSIDGNQLLRKGVQPGPLFRKALQKAQHAAWNGASEAEQLHQALRVIVD